MSKTEKESISGDTKKLLLRLKTVEAQLKQSIPKKEHEEVVSTLRANIEQLTSDLQRAKEEINRISDFNEKIKGIYDSINNQSKAIAQLGKAIEVLNKKINDGTVPMNIHQQALSKQREYEERISQMIPKEDYVSLQKRYEELLEKINTMVPKADYELLQSKISELESQLANMVPREELNASEQKVRQLEAKLANYVPRSDYEELAAKIVALAEEATSSSFDEGADTGESVAQQEVNEPIQQSLEVSEPTAGNQQPSLQQTSTIESTEPARPVFSEPVDIIKTSGSQISEGEEQHKWFRFENTDLCARTPIEFIEDLEKVPLETVQIHFERGDFEKWFRELSDESIVQSLQAIKEQKISGEQLRAKILELVTQRYKQSTY